MATFISLIKFTSQGISTIEDGPSRLDAGRQMLSDMGAELKAFYLTMGRFDAVAVVDAPDDETAARFALNLGRMGNVTTETLRAFNEDEYRQLTDSLS
ncbi:MAG: GYD domain-containing protein [Actinomycetota bacterium]|nr:GYD domain-containing protein [Actinomycetota bacterium]